MCTGINGQLYYARDVGNSRVVAGSVGSLKATEIFQGDYFLEL